MKTYTTMDIAKLYGKSPGVVQDWARKLKVRRNHSKQYVWTGRDIANIEKWIRLGRIKHRDDRLITAHRF